MRETNVLDPNVVSLLEAFNLIGRRLNGADWIGNEAAAIRLGQRSHVDAQARKRGLDALKTMRSFAENGAVNLIYTDHSRRRVPYFQNAGYWLTAIYPDPLGTGEGQLELDDRYLQPCVADVSALRKWRPTPKARTGPKQRYDAFEAACVEFFRAHPTNLPNEFVLQFAKDKALPGDTWPKKSWRNALINRARERQQMADRPAFDSGQMPDGHL